MLDAATVQLPMFALALTAELPAGSAIEMLTPVLGRCPRLPTWTV